MLEKVKQFVNESFAQRNLGKSNPEHFERTVYWVQQLNPQADKAVLIAAYAHDIARAFQKIGPEQALQACEFNDSDILEAHQQEGARILKEFLEKQEFDPTQIKRIVNMIAKHEVGGDQESDLIKDADSISYFEVNAPRHATKLVAALGKDKVERKIRWMFERISSARARQMAEPFYKKVRGILKSS